MFSAPIRSPHAFEVDAWFWKPSFNKHTHTAEGSVTNTKEIQSVQSCTTRTVAHKADMILHSGTHNLHFFIFLWPCIISISFLCPTWYTYVYSVIYIFTSSASTCFGHYNVHLQEMLIVLCNIWSTFPYWLPCDTLVWSQLLTSNQRVAWQPVRKRRPDVA
jgi:hypothetical protein